MSTTRGWMTAMATVVWLLGASCSTQVDDDSDAQDDDTGDDDTGDDDTADDDTGDDDTGGVVVGPLIELPLLGDWDPKRPFNHSAEVTVAAHDGHVAAAYINMHFDGADTFEVGGNDFHKRVGVAVSHDHGASYTILDPGLGDQTTDPVIRAGADGTFYLTTWDTWSGNRAKIGASVDHGDSWQVLAEDIWVGDKQWIAVDDGGGAIYVAGMNGYWKYSMAGTMLGSHEGGEMMIGAYADAAAAHFIGGWCQFEVTRWDGSGAPVQEGDLLEGGCLDEGTPDQEINVTAAIGETASGQQWIVRALRDVGHGEVVVQVRAPPAIVVDDIRISTPGAVAFFPAADLDDSGRLHVIWYENTPADGVLMYTRSHSADFEDGFAPPIVVDDEACPVQDWYPYVDSASGGRRLREYIDLAVDGNRAHLAWVHAPTAPSRVYTTYVEFP